MKIYSSSRNRDTFEDILSLFAEKDVWVKFRDYRDRYCYIKFDEPSYYAFDGGSPSFYYQKVMDLSLEEHAGTKMISEDRIKGWEFLEDYHLCKPLDTLTTDEILEMLQG